MEIEAAAARSRLRPLIGDSGHLRAFIHHRTAATPALSGCRGASVYRLRLTRQQVQRARLVHESSWDPSLDDPTVAELHEINRPIDSKIKTAQALRPTVRYRPGLPTRTIIPAIPTVCSSSHRRRDDPFEPTGHP